MALQRVGDERDATDWGGRVMWSLRVAWLALPFTVGIAATDATGGWAGAPRVVAAVLLWTVWGTGLVATSAPRPISLSVLRTAAPLSLAVAVVAVPGASTFASIAAVVLAVVVTALAASSTLGETCASGAAYGDERRFPLKVPTPLLFGPLPLAIGLVGTGVALGPLLLAERRYVPGAIALVIGLPVAAFLARSLHGLSRRWAVLVPAGLVIVDPFTLADPALFVRERIAAVGTVPTGTLPPNGNTVDLRLGAVFRSMELRLREPVELVRSVRRRRGGQVQASDHVLFAPTGTRTLLRAARARRIAVR